MTMSMSGRELLKKKIESAFYWAKCNHPDAPDKKQEWHLVHIKKNTLFQGSPGMARNPNCLGIQTVDNSFDISNINEYSDLVFHLSSGGSWEFEKIQKPDSDDRAELTGVLRTIMDIATYPSTDKPKDLEKRLDDINNIASEKFNEFPEKASF